MLSTHKLVGKGANEMFTPSLKCWQKESEFRMPAWPFYNVNKVLLVTRDGIQSQI